MADKVLGHSHRRLTPIPILTAGAELESWSTELAESHLEPNQPQRRQTRNSATEVTSGQGSAGELRNPLLAGALVKGYSEGIRVAQLEPKVLIMSLRCLSY